jgi:epoxyqueuosine reductase
VLTGERIKSRAFALGFDLCGIARAERHSRLARLGSWIAEGRSGDMRYLQTSLAERLDVSKVLPTARSVISLAVVYNTAQPYSSTALQPGQVAIARYAWGDDYHEVVRPRLRALLQWMNDTHGPGLEAFSCVDDGPVQERVFAEQAGLGWIGKNTCLINPRLGSWLFLAEIACNLELAADQPGTDQCGTCTRCLDACPTGAIAAPYTVDATRCLSYLTIEQRGRVDPDLRGALGQRVFGCDICQEVCPWNRRAPESDAPEWQPRDGLRFPQLLELCRLSDEGWRAILKGSAMRRAGLRRIRRSLAFTASHLQQSEAVVALDALEGHVSAQDEEVAEALIWARGQVSVRHH